jgi:EAL domain-containing protein (putative c-di-GMP-specific phosphodiesterase class I)
MQSTVCLVVDDDAAVRRALARLLGRGGRVQMLEAADAVSALRTMEQQPVDVVVSDEVMPQMTGIRLLESIRTNWPTTRRVLYTGHPNADLVMEAINRGGVEKVLTKSMHPEELRAELSEILGAPPAEEERGPRLSEVPSGEPQRAVLVVADDPAAGDAHRKVLTEHGFAATVVALTDVQARVAEGARCDVLIADLSSPDLDVAELMRTLRGLDLDCPILVTAPRSEVERAHEAMRHGAHRYLLHPVPRDKLVSLVDQGATLRRLATLRRSAARVSDAPSRSWELPDRAALENCFRRAIGGLFMVYQPIVSWSQQRVVGYESLVRSREPSLGNPGALFDAASRLARSHELRRAIRTLSPLPFTRDDGTWLFLNVHVDDLAEDALLEEALLAMSDRVVLEITERANLTVIEDATSRLADLRERGFRVAVDDLGAGYAGLTSFATLEPDLAKLDMTLVRNIERAPVKQRLVSGLLEACADLGVAVVAEGVETVEERDTLLELGCDLLQGYLFARPGDAFPTVRWG